MGALAWPWPEFLPVNVVFRTLWARAKQKWNLKRRTTLISASYLIHYTVAVNYNNYVNCHTTESRILVWTVRAVRVAVTDEAGVGTVAILTLELANGTTTGRAGLRFIWAITTIWLAVTLPPYRNTPKDKRKVSSINQKDIDNLVSLIISTEAYRRKCIWKMQ